MLKGLDTCSIRYWKKNWNRLCQDIPILALHSNKFPWGLARVSRQKAWGIILHKMVNSSFPWCPSFFSREFTFFLVFSSIKTSVYWNSSSFLIFFMDDWISGYPSRWAQHRYTIIGNCQSLTKAFLMLLENAVTNH